MVSWKTDVIASDKNGKRLLQVWQISTEYPKYSSVLPRSANSIPKLQKLGKIKIARVGRRWLQIKALNALLMFCILTCIQIIFTIRPDHIVRLLRKVTGLTHCTSFISASQSNMNINFCRQCCRQQPQNSIRRWSPASRIVIQWPIVLQ